MKKTVRAAATALLLAGTLSAAQAPAEATGCHWKVRWPTAGVYELPSNASTLVKTKYSGDIVGPYCTEHLNTSEGKVYVAVHCDMAADDVGWMRKDALIRMS